MTTGWDDTAGRRRLTLSIAHDLGYVMNAIASQAERLLEDAAPDSATQRRVHAIRRATAFGERLARELLTADARAVVPSAMAHAAPDNAPNAPSRRAPRGPTVLVVVAETGVRELIVEILELHDFVALPARDHRDADRLRLAYAGSIALVIADTAPGTDGARRADRLRRARHEVRRLYLSDSVDGQHSLAKPFSVDALVRKVREVLAEATD
jgi:CheY-like chemotaxis protein